MKIFDNRTFETKNKKSMSVEEFINETNDNDYCKIGDAKIKIFDNNYFDDDMEAPIFNLLELDERQWNSEILIAHIFKELVILMIA